jgi:hypothetical protein
VINQKVDVLAVMDTDGRAVALLADTFSAGGHLERQWLDHLKKHDKARAALSELIEAATDACAFVGYDGNGAENVKDRLNAALARIGSEATEG